MTTTFFLQVVLSLFATHANVHADVSPLCEQQVRSDADLALPGGVTAGQSRRICHQIAQAEYAPGPVGPAPTAGTVRTSLVCGHVLAPVVGGLACYDWRKREWYGLGGVFLGTGGSAMGVGLMLVDHPESAPVGGDYSCIEVSAGLGFGGSFLGCRAYGTGQYMTYYGGGLSFAFVLQGSPILTLRKF